MEGGTPCTNCRLDQVECVVSDSKRRKKPQSEEERTQSPVSSTDEIDELLEFPSFEDVEAAQNSSSLDGFFAPLDFDMDHHVPHMLCM